MFPTWISTAFWCSYSNSPAEVTAICLVKHLCSSGKRDGDAASLLHQQPAASALFGQYLISKIKHARVVSICLCRLWKLWKQWGNTAKHCPSFINCYTTVTSLHHSDQLASQWPVCITVTSIHGCLHTDQHVYTWLLPSQWPAHITCMLWQWPASMNLPLQWSACKTVFTVTSLHTQCLPSDQHMTLAFTMTSLYIWLSPLQWPACRTLLLQWPASWLLPSQWPVLITQSVTPHYTLYNSESHWNWHSSCDDLLKVEHFFWALPAMPRNEEPTEYN